MIAIVCAFGAKHSRKAVAVLSGIFLCTSPAAFSKDWNYFGTCASDDTILAEKGKFYTPCFGRDCTRQWFYGGTYQTITDGVIEIFWVTDDGRHLQETYTHRSLYKKKCKR